MWGGEEEDGKGESYFRGSFAKNALLVLVLMTYLPITPYCMWILFKLNGWL
jgi:hypothetical protein